MIKIYSVYIKLGKMYIEYKNIYFNTFYKLFKRVL
uniref:Uncharacterized protein n=1 Tax=viral metagenome TaxID=1070528 RepID=A0A6C0AFW5_9ZZZZ